MNKDIAPVLAEISAVLKKHDMAGLVIVSNATHTDYVMEIAPTWSCARFETLADGSCGLRLRSKLADYPDQEAQKKTLEATLGMLVTFNDTMQHLTEQNSMVLVKVAQHIPFVGKSTRLE